MSGNRIAALVAASVTGIALLAMASTAKPGTDQHETRCSEEDVGLSLPPGFCATVFADNLGHARHMAVAPDGRVYVNTTTHPLYRLQPDPQAGFIVGLRDADGDGRAEQVRRFGPTPAMGSIGGTGLAWYRDALFAELDDRIVRFDLKDGQLVPAGSGVTVLAGLSTARGHTEHPLAIDAAGNLFVNSGSETNSCQTTDRETGAPGRMPCTELNERAGIWRYRADKRDQQFSEAERYATGIRNSGGMDFDAAGRLFAIQHGRDQLAQSWPSIFTVEQGAELPAEELLRVEDGADYGWPYCYYDGLIGKRVMAPEYGGNGKRVGDCGGKRLPIATYPAHWAPNGIAIYRGNEFPVVFRGGAFVAFHGSWNRAPMPQAGYNVIFQPLANGRSSGRYILFADGFTGPSRTPDGARFRPAGVAVGHDGALFVSDDTRGRIWRITYRGPLNAPLTEAAAATSVGTVIAPAPTISSEVTDARVALGRRIFHGEERDGTCSSCHGAEGRGTSMGPRLTGPDWIWGDGSVAFLRKITQDGVPKPKRSMISMPARGAASLTDTDIDALVAYMRTLSETSSK